MKAKTAFIRGLIILGSAAVIAAFAVSHAPRSGPRAREDAYRAGIRTSLEACRAFEAETAVVPLTTTNTGSKAWESGGKALVFVSYHLRDAAGKSVRFENARFPFAGKVAPGKATSLEVTIKAPLEAGNYLLEFDLVAEGHTWFADRGSKPLVIPLKVARRDWPEDKFVLSLENGPYTKIDSDVPEFNSLMKLIRVTLKHNEVSFKGRTGRVDGFSAGAGYPQIWVRDANTIIPASKYFYAASFLRSWLVELLSYQGPDGSLPDWFDSRGVTDKNTVETDQEASAVQAGGQVYEVLGPEWDLEEIRGVPAYERMERALEFVLKERYDSVHGLIKGAHTADWGDVEMEDADQSALYTGETTRWTSDIYDQAMFYQAAQDLAFWFEVLGLRDKAIQWRYKAQELQKNTNTWLWQEDRGFFRVHVHTGPWRHDLDEDSMFAMGGNAQAMISGLAGDPGQGKKDRIIEQALSRQKEFDVSTISGSLLPPYPAGFFKHPALDEPYEYQNGGQWDWFGGKFVLAMFESGFAREAREKLLEIARKNIANSGLYEWDTKDGRGRGSDFYSGSAGSLARALIEGYFGIRISRHHLEISPRLGLANARVHIHLPAAGRFVAYDYRTDDKARKLRLEISSDNEFGPTVRILDPWAPPKPLRRQDDPADFEVRVNGRKSAFRLQRVGRDVYICLDVLTTRFKNKRGVIELSHPRPAG